MKETEQEPTDLDWVQLRKDLINIPTEETFRDKLSRKVALNPFVPIGVLLTTGALSYGLWSFRQGNKKMSQNMMRLRIAAQGFTVAALVIGVIMSSTKQKNKT